MADLVLTADVSSIRDAEKALKRFSDASEKLGRSVLNTANKVQSVSSGWDQANKLYKQGVLNSKALAAAQTELARELATLNGYTKSNGALNTQRALAELKAAQAARESARATEEAARAAQQAAQRQNELRMRYQEGYAAFARARNEMRGLREAMRAGIITTDQYRERVRLLREEMNRSGDAAQGAGRRMSRTGVVFQQAGYQIGDFAVQVQSGTHYMVALGQQLTQLVGVGAMLARSTAWIAAFSALGIIVPIATAVAGAFMRIKKESDGLKEAEENVKSLTRAVEEWKTAKAALDLGVSSDVYKGMKAFEIAVENARETLKTLRQDLLESGEGSVMKVVAQDMLANLGIGEGSLESQAQAALDKYNELGELLKSLRQIEAEKKDKFVQKLDRELQLQQEIKRFGEDSLNVADLRLEFQKEDLVAQAKKLGFSEDEIALLVRKLILTQETLRELEAAERAQKALLEDTSAAGDEMVKAFEAAKSLREEIGEGAAKALELAGVDITKPVSDALKEAAALADKMDISLEQAIKFNATNMSSGVSAAAKAAAELAKQMNISLRAAMAMMGMIQRGPGFKGDAGDPRAAAGDSPEQAMARRLARVQELMETPPSFGKIGFPKVSGGGGGGGGRDPAQAASEYLEKLQREAEFKLQLVGLSEQEQRGMEIKKQYLERLEQDNRNLTETEQARIDAILKAEEALKKATEAEQRREAIQETISSNIENALMSVVDGTKSVEDAFKGMLRNILLEIYRQTVAKPIATGIASFFGFANGGAFSGGKVVPFANGGVVGGPTFFPMAGGKTGLMGEAGPEAIMPLKRGPDGKLGVEGGGNVTVQQTFNFAANGDESVKRIIAEAAPKIANLTQKQILDSRRRGGTMKATFG